MKERGSLRMLIKRILLPALAVTGLAAPVQAERGFRDHQLAEFADAAYMKDGVEKAYPAPDYYYGKLKGISDRATGVQALAFERKTDHQVVVAFAGTDPKDFKDLLADLGIVGAEATTFLNRASGTVTEGLQKSRIISARDRKKVEAALAKDYGGLRTQYARASKKGSAKFSCPKGSFFDLIDGGTCWSCPSGMKRTADSVKSSRACRRAGYEKYSRTSKYRKNKRIGQGCPRGKFWDVKGGKGLLGACYSCPSGYRRSGHAVNHARACSKKVSASHSKASLRSKALCPSGSFFDAIDGGSCWSCPSKFKRHVTSVKSAQSCIRIDWVKNSANANVKVNAQTEAQLKKARQFLSSVLRARTSDGRPVIRKNVTIVGHSLGGFISQILAAENSLKAVTFNAPGAGNYNPRLRSSKVRNITRRSDPVGQMGKHIGPKSNVADAKFRLSAAAKYLMTNHSSEELMKDLKAWDKSPAKIPPKPSSESVPKGSAAPAPKSPPPRAAPPTPKAKTVGRRVTPRRPRKKRCAREGAKCNFRGHRTVRYGAKGKWTEKVLRGPVSCTNLTFGDPAPGIPKRCMVLTAPPKASRSCARENGRCKVGRGARFVYYGAGKNWTRKKLRGRVACTSRTFGDPAPGVRKTCRK